MRIALACLLTACAADPSVPPGGGGDGSGSGSGGQPAGTTAIVLRGGSPAAAVPVVFHDASGAVLATVPTDSAGHATFELSGPAMISVPQLRNDGTHQLDTMTGVQPGDTITFGLAREDIATDDIARLRIAGSPVTNASGYTVDSGCRSMSVTGLDPAPEIGIGSACVDASGVASVIVASRQSDGLPYSWAAATDVTVDSSGTATAQLSAWSTDFKGLFISHNNVPARALGFIGFAAAVHKDIPFRALAVPNSVTAFEGAGSTFILGYPEFGEATEVKLQFVTGDDPDTATGTSVVVARMPGHPEQLSFDTQATYLPALTGVTADRSAPARTKVSWAPAATGDAALVVVTGPASRWSIMTPPDAGTAQLPALPAELSAYAPASVTTADVFVADDDTVNGFDDARLGVGISLLDRPLRGDSARVRYVIERAP